MHKDHKKEDVKFINNLNKKIRASFEYNQINIFAPELEIQRKFKGTLSHNTNSAAAEAKICN
eukprot:9852006-Ditylum_brightwellii.AAC.2